MPKQMRLRGNILYAHCRVMGVELQDSLKTSDPKLAEQNLDHLKTLVRKGEYHSWKKTFEECTDEWLATRDMNKPYHMTQEVIVRVHLKPYFDNLKVDDIIKIKIPMVKMVEDILKNLRQVRKLHDKRIFQIQGDILPNRVRNLQRNWEIACKASGVDWHIRLKDLRHFFGSHLLNSGVDPLMIASFMGHASLDMLLKRYGHFTDQTRREAMLKFDGGCPNGAQTTSAVS